MDPSSSSAQAVASAAHHHHPLGGADIAKLLTSKGPVVKAVLLHCRKPDGTQGGDDEDSKQPAAQQNPEENHPSPPAVAAEANDNDDKEKKVAADDAAPPTTGPPTIPRVVLSDMIEEIQIDTTPNKSMVAKTLGGPFTFLGQYEDEGIVLMIRNLPDDLDDVVRNELVDEDGGDDDEETNNNNDDTIDLARDLPRLFKISQLKTLCRQRDIHTEGMLEKADLVKALMDYQANHLPPYNPHQLQPPLHKAKVRGDILCLRVAETAEELDQEEEEEETEKADHEKVVAAVDEEKEKSSHKEEEDEEHAKEIVVLSNEEFFLDYTKEEYLRFAARTDIPDHELEDPESPVDEDEDDEEEEEEEDVEDGGGEGSAAYIPGEDGEDMDEEDKNAMFNLVMNEVLRQYREDNGRGPNTKELLELRASIAKELDVKVAQVPDADWEKKAKTTPSPSSKKIAFQKEDKVKEFVPHEDEYNYDREPDAMAAAMLGVDDNDDDDNEDYTEPPAKKIKKTGEESNGDDDDDDDSKPAAVDEEKGTTMSGDTTAATTGA